MRKPSDPVRVQSSDGKPPAGEPRIRVDADWKKEAQAEKERLAREVEEKAAGGEADRGAPAGRMAGPEEEPPPATFETLVQMLATPAALFMAPHRDPETGQPVRRLDLAKHHIDLLGVLEEKTRGCLTEEERRMLEMMLYELRLAYVSAVSGEVGGSPA